MDYFGGVVSGRVVIGIYAAVVYLPEGHHPIPSIPHSPIPPGCERSELSSIRGPFFMRLRAIVRGHVGLATKAGDREFFYIGISTYTKIGISTYIKIGISTYIKIGISTY